MLTEAQKQLLLSEKEQNIALLYLAEEYPLTEVMQSGNMLMCRFISEEEWCHFSHNSTPRFIDDFFGCNSRGQYVVISDDHVFDYARKHHRLIWSITCHRLFLKDSVASTVNNLIQPLRPEHLKIVYDNSKYQQFLNLNYLSKRLELGGGYCVNVEDNPVGWMMTHDDGSVGMLHVLDDFRGRGYARMLAKAMSQRVVQKGREAYAHIEPSNEPSLKLFLSLGFEIRGKITWAFFS
jgi:ribosomal protein S18 acetylase RimI-like enzyme